MNNLNAQGFYISTNAGYAFGINSTSDFLQNRSYTGSSNEQTGEFSFIEEYSSVPFSLGKGANFGISVGYMFNDFVGLDLGVSYLYGGTSEAINQSYDKRTYGNGDIIIRESKGVTSFYSKMRRIIPSVVLSPNFQKWNPYTRIGVVIGIGSFNTDYESNFDDINGVANALSKKSEFKEGIAVGFNAAIGLNYVLNEKISLFGEANFIGMSYEPLKWNQTEYILNGVDQLPQTNVYSKEVDYVDSYVYNRSAVNYDEPRKE